MATDPTLHDAPLDIREQIVRIDKLIVEAGNVRQDTKFGPLTVAFGGLGAGAALFAAGAAFMKVVLG